MFSFLFLFILLFIWGGRKKEGVIVTGRSIETQEERERERDRCLFFWGGEKDGSDRDRGIETWEQRDRERRGSGRERPLLPVVGGGKRGGGRERERERDGKRGIEKERCLFWREEKSGVIVREGHREREAQRHGKRGRDR